MPPTLPPRHLLETFEGTQKLQDRPRRRFPVLKKGAVFSEFLFRDVPHRIATAVVVVALERQRVTACALMVGGVAFQKHALPNNGLNFFEGLVDVIPAHVRAETGVFLLEFVVGDRKEQRPVDYVFLRNFGVADDFNFGVVFVVIIVVIFPEPDNSVAFVSAVFRV